MNERSIKICLKCGGEYSLEALTCADCDGKLVFPEEYEKRYVPPEETEAEALVREGPENYLRELVSLLKREGIQATIRFHGVSPGT